MMFVCLLAKTNPILNHNLHSELYLLPWGHSKTYLSKILDRVFKNATEKLLQSTEVLFENKMVYLLKSSGRMIFNFSQYVQASLFIRLAKSNSYNILQTYWNQHLYFSYLYRNPQLATFSLLRNTSPGHVFILSKMADKLLLSRSIWILNAHYLTWAEKICLKKLYLPSAMYISVSFFVLHIRISKTDCRTY